MKDCQLCREGESEYPVELMTDGIIRRMLVCGECYNMVGAGEKRLKEASEKE